MEKLPRMTKWRKWCGLSGKLHLKSSRKECSQQSRWCSHRPARGPSHGQQSRWATEWKLIQQSRTSSANGHRVNGFTASRANELPGHMLITLTMMNVCEDIGELLWKRAGDYSIFRVQPFKYQIFGTWATPRHNSQLLWRCTASLQLLEVFLIPFQRWFCRTKPHQYYKFFGTVKIGTVTWPMWLPCEHKAGTKPVYHISILYV